MPYTYGMNVFFRLPLLFLTFWYLQAPQHIVLYFASLNKAFLQLFSLPLFVRTYFQPWKNEYREGLVGFSRGMGIFIKTIFIFVDTLLLCMLLALEALFLAFFLLWPVVTIAVLFVKL